MADSITARACSLVPADRAAAAVLEGTARRRARHEAVSRSHTRSTSSSVTSWPSSRDSFNSANVACAAANLSSESPLLPVFGFEAIASDTACSARHSATAAVSNLYPTSGAPFSMYGHPRASQPSMAWTEIPKISPSPRLFTIWPVFGKLRLNSQCRFSETSSDGRQEPATHRVFPEIAGCFSVLC